jgi:hypothetical protein
MKRGRTTKPPPSRCTPAQQDAASSIPVVPDDWSGSPGARRRPSSGHASCRPRTFTHPRSLYVDGASSGRRCRGTSCSSEIGSRRRTWNTPGRGKQPAPVEHCAVAVVSGARTNLVRLHWLPLQWFGPVAAHGARGPSPPTPSPLLVPTGLVRIHPRRQVSLRAPQRIEIATTLQAFSPKDLQRGGERSAEARTRRRKPLSPNNCSAEAT